MVDKVSIGDMAPDFRLRSQTGATVSLSDFRGKKAVVLFFYPKDNSPGCTKEVCSFRDSYAEFQDAGAEVIGISSDSLESHSIFSTTFALPYMLLSDEGGAVRKLYGVPASMGLIPGRVTYVIDKEGVVRNIFSSQMDIERHVQESLTILKSLEK